MPTSISSNKVYFKVHPTDVATALSAGISIECVTQLSENFASNVAEQATMHCGVIKTVGAPSISVSGSGLVVGDVTGTEASAQALKGYIQDNTRLYFAVTNITDGGTIAANEVAYMTGSGFFNAANTNYSADELAQFDFEFAVDGTVDLTV